MSEGVFDRPPGDRYFRHPGDVIALVLWSALVAALILVIEVADRTSTGLDDDLGRAAASLALPARQLLLAAVQLMTLAVPAAAIVALCLRRRWRRLGVVAASATAGALAVAGLDAAIDLDGPTSGALGSEGWLLDARFPSLPAVGAAVAALTVATPWLSRPWQRSSRRLLAAAVVAMLIAGSAGATTLLVTVALGAVVGTAVLVIVGAPNRRPTPAAVAAALARAGVAVDELELRRATGGRAQLYAAGLAGGGRAFLKVRAVDSRDAARLYRIYRRAVLRDPGDAAPMETVAALVEHEALMLVLAGAHKASCPELLTTATLPDGSAVMAMEDTCGRRLDQLAEHELVDGLLERVWQEVAVLHDAGMAHGALRMANVLVTPDGRPTLIDFGASSTSASARTQAIDRAELLVSMATVVGPDRALAATRSSLDVHDLGASVGYLQPLALSAATRAQASKAMLGHLRTGIATATGSEPAPLERLVRVRARTVIIVATLAGAFYVLLPQLANVDESVEAVRSAEWSWLTGSVVLSLLTYVGAAIALAGAVDVRLPLYPTMHAQLASSFVNRVTPAKVGGLALNVRFLQKAGVDPAVTVTAIGLNVVAGGVVHLLLLLVFFAWAGRGGGTGFSVPTDSRTLVVIAVVLAVIGVAAATRWGQRLVRRQIAPFVRRGVTSVVALARSPGRLAALVGGSLLITLAYIGALVCAMTAFDAGASFAQVGAVYLGASVLAAAAPTPGGLGAMEAALVAGFTAVGIDATLAVAAVLSYRLATFWLPILPGWLSFQLLQRRGYL